MELIRPFFVGCVPPVCWTSNSRRGGDLSWSSVLGLTWLDGQVAVFVVYSVFKSLMAKCNDNIVYKRLCYTQLPSATGFSACHFSHNSHQVGSRVLDLECLRLRRAILQEQQK